MGGVLRRGARFVIASHNEGKVREMAELLAPLGIETVSAAKLKLPEPEETGESFADNARLKA
ncbi:MAG: non-canonical purine NTP pyrophosphatase, partial [Methyloceanibacter sp.]